MRVSDEQRLIDRIVATVPELIAIYRFGSTVRGAVHSGSDVDLAILARHALDATRRYDLAQELAVLLAREVDVVDLRAASTVMRMQVLSAGRCVFCSDEPARRHFEMLAYADYARLNEERRDILRRVRDEGRVYG
jgi:predicted nucleotidyltransferase